MANIYQYMANQGKKRVNAEAIQDATTNFMTSYKLGQEIQLKRQEMENSKAQAPMKMALQSAQLENLGLIPAGTTQSMIAGQMPTSIPQGQAQAPVGQLGAVAPRATTNYPVVPKEAARIGGQIAEEEATREGKLETRSREIEQDIEKTGKTTKERKSAETSVAAERLLPSTVNVTSSFLEYGKELYNKTGLIPGTIGGVVTSLSPNEINAANEQFKGAQLENAAQVMAASIAGARAVRGLSMFKKDAPNNFSTIVSGINNSRRSLIGAVMKDIAANPNDYLDYGMDPNLSLVDRTYKAEEIATKIGDDFRDRFLTQVAEEAPMLIGDREIRIKYQKMAVEKKKMEELKALESELFGGAE